MNCRRGLRASLLALVVLLVGCTEAGLSALNLAARLGDYEREADIAYGPLAEQRLDIYRPTVSATEASPVVLFFYGGCWGGCQTWPKEDYRFVGEALAEQGFVAVLADYRLHPDVRFDAIMEDAVAATRWTTSNIASRGGDPGRVFVMGHSAGAHIASMLAMNDRYLASEQHAAIAGFIGLAGPYDFLPLDKPYQYTLFGPPELYPESQPVNYVDGDEPPTLLLYGADDTTVKPRNHENLAAKLKQVGVPVATAVYAGVDHGGLVAALARPLQDRHPVMNDISSFVQQSVLKPNLPTRSAQIPAL